MTTTISNKKHPTLDCHVDGCNRPVGKAGDLVCQPHWRLVPRYLRLALIESQKARDSAKKRDRVLVWATAVLGYLAGLKIQLPPASAEELVMLEVE